MTEFMATTGETIWAGLIASSKPPLYSLFHDGESAYLTFTFEKGKSFHSAVTPLREFRFERFEWPYPRKVKPVVHLHILSRRRLTTVSNLYTFRVSWNYHRSLNSSSYLYVFPSDEKHVLGRVWALDKSTSKPIKTFVSFPTFKRTVQGIRWRIKPPFPTVTPLQLFTKVKTGVLFSSLKLVKAKANRGPFIRKLRSPRPNPEVITRSFINAHEIEPGVPYNVIVTNEEIFRRDWTGTVTPGFGSKKGRQLPVNPHTVYLRKTNYTYGYDLRSNSGNPALKGNSWGPHSYNGSIAFDAPLTSSAPLLVELGSKALKKLNSNANAGVQANMAQNFAQYKQVTNMIANTATRIAGSVLALKKGQFGKAADFLFAGRSANPSLKKGKPTKSKTLANNWLELQYGWKPLLSDIDESMRILADYMVKSQSYQSTRGSASTYFTFDQALTTNPWGANIKAGIYQRAFFGTVRYGIRYKVSNPTLSALAQLGFTNPVNLIWEVLPYSFVVDWFLPIGPYLEAMSAPHGLEFVDGFKTIFGKKVHLINFSWRGKLFISGSYDTWNAYGLRTRDEIVLDRSKLTAYPTPDFPSFRNPFSTIRALNAIALMRQAFR